MFRSLRNSYKSLALIPGYGSPPIVMISHNTIPNDQLKSINDCQLVVLKAILDTWDNLNFSLTPTWFQCIFCIIIKLLAQQSQVKNREKILSGSLIIQFDTKTIGSPCFDVFKGGSDRAEKTYQTFSPVLRG